MPGMLYLCATPIGNLGDMTPRVVETLQSVDLIAAEDTRNSIKLLNHFGIRTSMTSYHEYNKVEKADYLLGQMRQGKNVALISDAGTPAISDPGEVLVQKCQEAGVTVTSLPGPTACITALTLSGLSSRRFCFEGFLPSDKKEKAQVFAELKEESRTIILYEAPHHLVRTLGELYEALGDRRITICRELVEGKRLRQKEEERQASWQNMTVEEHMALYTGGGMDEKAAMKQVAKDRGVPKREIYAAIHGTGMR